jgi:membrane-associated phospholipid phosphatase
MLDFIQYYDEIAFHQINGVWRDAASDVFFPFMRRAKNWIPLYIFLLGYIYYYFKKDFIKIFCLVALTMIVSDVTSSHLIKKTVRRTRPCRETALPYEPVRQIICSPGYSYPSSHATNHYALAAILSLTIFRRKKGIQLVFFTWAALIAYGQVYVGVHYPFDIFCGMLLGTSIAVLVSKVYLRYFPIPF